MAIEDFGTAWRALVQQAENGFSVVLTLREVPIGFRGVEPMHGNLGYAASQSIVLVGICIFMAWREHSPRKMYLATLAVALCFASILIARSRGAILFSTLMLLSVMLTCSVKWTREQAGYALPRFSKRWMYGAAGLFFALAFLAYQSVRHDQRWQSMADKVQIGFMLDAPAEVLCNGVSTADEANIRNRLQGHSPGYIDDVLSGLKGQDGGRILLMRVGTQLVQENPRGFDGSRQSYEKLMVEKCGHAPQLHFAHSHQSWIDLSLALGWVGALLYAGVLLYFMRHGWSNLQRPDVKGWATALFLLCLFWAARGMVDSIYREHYLQMQAVLIAYAYWRVRLVNGGTP